MLAEYPGGGTHYVRHRDSAPSEYAGRKLTALYYMNPRWKPAQGGKLRLWKSLKLLNDEGFESEADDGDFIDIEPVLDRLVLFRSYMEHQVMPAYFSRMVRQQCV